MGWMVNATPRPLKPPEGDPVSAVQEAGRAPGPVWTVAKNLAPTGIRSPNRPTRSESNLILNTIKIGKYVKFVL